MENIWIIGTGVIAQEYSKILFDLDINFTVIGRGQKNVDSFNKLYPSTAIVGGISNFLKQKPLLPDAVIVAADIESLFSISKELIEFGVKKILIEKPGVLSSGEAEELNEVSRQYDCEVFIAYNRRFFSSVIKAREIIVQDGGVSSLAFDFTEWSHIVGKLEKPNIVLSKWLIANSSHVIDMSFYLAGLPKEMACFHSGSLPWHPSASQFAGAGLTVNRVPFSYHANWESPGRWGIELMTRKHKLYFRPLEQLAVQKIGSVQVDEVLLENELDKKYKPGFFLQTKKFIEGDYEDLCSLSQQVEFMDVFNKIGNY